MSRQRGQVGVIILIGIVILVLAVIGLFAVCTPNDDSDHSLGRAQLAYHQDRDCGEEWDDCGYDDGGNYGDGNYGQGRNSGGGGGNGNRGRRGDNQRGDKNCHSFCGNTIIVPTPPGMGGGDQPPPDEQRTRSVGCLVPVPFHCDPKLEERT